MGDPIHFPKANSDTAIRRLANRIPEGVVRANERTQDDQTED